MLNLHKVNASRNRSKLVVLIVATLLVGSTIVAPLLPYSTVLANNLNPGQVSSITSVTKIAAGHIHSLFLKSDGTVWAVGNNSAGQLGDGTTTNRSTVVQVTVSGGANLTNVVEIAAGAAHSIARKSDGTVVSWGDNTYGQLGDTTTTLRTRAVTVSGVSNAIGIASGEYHNLALISGGTVMSWGRNNFGQLGDGTTTDASTAITISSGSLSDAIQVACGGFHSVALRSASGKLKAWGKGGDSQLANPNPTCVDSSTPIKMRDNAGVEFTGGLSVTAGVNFTTIVAGNNKVWTTGQDGRGQQGLGCIGTNCGFKKIGLAGTSKVSAGCTAEHVQALNPTDTKVSPWGRNEYGQLGNGNTTDQCSPTTVKDSMGADETGFTDISGGGLHTLALKNNTPYSWGDNTYGQLGRP